MKRVIIIAEAGVNHNGDMELAKELIDAAAQAGADYVKFQTFITEYFPDCGEGGISNQQHRQRREPISNGEEA
jgi:sialic acid synthase SpsE